jgi:S-formylglutathione hydrolase FrmB
MASANPEKCPPLDPKKLEAPVAKALCFSTTFHSQSLGKKVEFDVLVPPGYSNKKSTLYPYAIFLHGRGGDKDSLVYTDGVENLNDVVNKGAQPFLVFAPSGGNNYWMNGAISKVRTGDMVTKDFVAHIEKAWPVYKNNPNMRALFGISMGGNGALQLGLNNPKEFSTVFSYSPVFRTPKEIWTPENNNNEPKEDYYSYGVGKDYEARSPRHLCQKLKKPGSDRCLPFKNYRLEIGSNDPFLKSTPDTKLFIEELAKAHPEFEIGIRDCDQKAVCEAHKDCNSHAGSYWSCRMPYVMTWISEQFVKDLPRSN